MRIRIFFTIALAGMVVLVSGAAWAASTSEVWVDDDFNSATEGWGENYFSSIQDGIDEVAPGGTVNVAAGTYDESLSVTKDNLTIKAADGESPVIQQAEIFSGGVRRLIDIRGDNVLFEGLEVVGNGKNDLEDVTGSYVGISVSGQGVIVKNNIIRNLLTGIQTTTANEVGSVEIYDNTISNVAVGISLQNDNNTFDGNDITAIDVGFGIASFNTTWGANQITTDGYEATISGDSYKPIYLGSIQDGINAVSDGATIKVDVGAFIEDVNLIKKSL